MPAKRTWSQEQLSEAVSSSNSIRQVLSKLGLKEAGGCYSFIAKKIQDFNLDTSHFTGMLWSKGKRLGYKNPIEDYLTNKRYITSHNLRLRLIDEGIFEHKCYSCQLVEWRGKPIPLELEHRNGKHSDNTLENLTLLCPNCHAQTSTHCSKNTYKYKKRMGLI